ncbi:hypothetical protein CW751_07945 [Brumimicrobium salinarum]|uniref:Alpha/beta hydrolase n=1 Tax=Brumimicrobium salinarum TaxID=2058658 RepID=A0A2I0R276_9FLAO|nr:hypothetical protein [Brumimicrobium salinarum]PKR80693.1 hypothetical protein CW751_07945 [Brumimicrobium salinarum]
MIAPDGLDDNNFYSWSQRQWWTRKLFRRWVKKPKELMSISKVLSKLKLIDPKIVDFLDFYTSDPEKFERAYQTWSAFRKLRPSEEKVKEVLQKHQVNFNLIVGEYDKIITPKSAKQFASKVKQLDQLKLLPFGHDIFKPHIKEELFDIMMFEEL